MVYLSVLERKALHGINVIFRQEAIPHCMCLKTKFREHCLYLDIALPGSSTAVSLLRNNRLFVTVLDNKGLLNCRGNESVNGDQI
jgi:hypothetical protein